jgi:chitinase
MKQKIILFLMISLLLPSLFIAASGKPESTGAKKIISYIRTWPMGSTTEDMSKNIYWKAEDINGDKLTTLNLAFGLIKDGTNLYIKDMEPGKDGTPGFTSLFDEVAKIQKKYPKLRINLSIGGWGADGFSDMAMTAKTRNEFTANVMTWVRKYKLNGIDIDWEYPVNGGWGAIKSRPEDRENFTLLLKTLRDSLDAYGKETGARMELSFAAGASPDYVNWIEPSKVAAIVDYAKLMTYDYYGSWSATTGHLANLFLNPLMGSDLNDDMVVKNYLKAGFPRNKLVMGVPFYGRGWKGVENKANGLFQKYKESAYPDGITYPDILARLTAANGFTRYWDDAAKAPYLYNGDIFVTYEDPQSLGEKMKYIKDQGLCGVMIWEYAHDMDNVLLDAINKNLK